jgi:tRNA(adenine34) deaminase
MSEQNDLNQASRNQADIDERWMTEALSLAKTAADLGEVPVGAVLVDSGNRVIGRGWNQPIAGCDPTAHAEIIALREGAKRLGNYRLPDTTLYVSVEPCAMCAGAMLHARIKRLVFATAEPKAGAVVSRLQLLSQAHNNHQVEVSQGLLADAAAALISGFFAKRRAEIKQ